MKQLIFWGSLIIISAIAFIFFDKISIIKTIWDPEISTWWFDLILFLLAANIFFTRGYYLIIKIVKILK